MESSVWKVALSRFFLVKKKLWGEAKAPEESRYRSYLSSTVLIVFARSLFVRGFMANALMPASFARSASTRRLKPVHRMIGISGRSARTSLARSSPVISGMVWSVMIRSNANGSSLTASKASKLLFLTVTA